MGLMTCISQEDDWAEDANLFVSQEDDEIQFSTRSSAFDLLNVGEYNMM
jgi:hypothetical protein